MERQEPLATRGYLVANWRGTGEKGRAHGDLPKPQQHLAALMGGEQG